MRSKDIIITLRTGDLEIVSPGLESHMFRLGVFGSTPLVRFTRLALCDEIDRFCWIIASPSGTVLPFYVACSTPTWFVFNSTLGPLSMPRRENVRSPTLVGTVAILWEPSSETKTNQC